MPGQLIKRAERVWMVRVFLGREPETGKRIFQNKTVHGVKKDAEKVLAELLRTRSLGPSLLKNERLLVGELLDDLIRDYSINGRVVEAIKIKIEKYLRPKFGKLVAAKLTSTALAQYADDRMKSGAAPATVNREMSMLRRAFNLGFKAEPKKVDRLPNFPVFRENNVRKGFFEHHEFVAMRAHLPLYLKSAITMAYYTGMRKSEILGLRWEQVDLRAGIIRLEVGETKSGEGRTLPIAGELLEMLKLERERRDVDFSDCTNVFHIDGKPFHDFRDSWATAAKMAGLVDAQGKPTKLFHDLRRTGVRNLVRAGVSEQVAMRISGHKTRAVFERYNVTSEADLKNAVDKLRSYVENLEAIRREDAEGKSSGVPSKNRHTIGTQGRKEGVI